MRRASLLLLAGPLVLVLAACGGSGRSASAPQQVQVDPAKYVRHAAVKTAQAPSEHMTMTGKVTASGIGISMSGSGDFSNARHQGTFTAAFSFAGMNGKIDEVLDGTTIYMSSPLFSTGLPAGKKWVKLDLATFGKSQGIDYSALMSRSPTQAFQQLEAAGKVTKVGSATIDGVRTTHFRVEHLDISKLPQGAKLEALAHPAYGPIDVWIDNGNGYVRRETMSFSYTVKGHKATMSMTSDFSKFGEPVRVAVPPANETLDGTKLASKGLGG